VLGILGGIAAFLGLFILVAEEEQYIGLGGDFSWRVGDISATWTYGLLAGGAVALLAVLGMMAFAPRVPRERAGFGGLGNLLVHAGVFLVVNGFIWAQDLAIGGGVEYAYWVTIPWAVGLLVHAAVYGVTAGRQDQPRELPR
jgi:hypothetical protein